MAVPKKDRFVDTGLKIAVGNVDDFPPETFKYRDFEFTVLGLSNKDDLIPVNVDNLEMQKIVTLGNLGQYICTNQVGDIFDACFYKGEDDNIYLYAIRTREKPEKPKKPKN